MKNQGLATAFTRLDQFAMGFRTNPAHVTTAARFDGFVIAYFSAMGVENDSAKITNGSVLGTAALRSGSSSLYGRNLFVGYVTTVAVKVQGRALRKSANSCPVASKPGRSTKCLRANSPYLKLMNNCQINGDKYPCH